MLKMLMLNFSKTFKIMMANSKQYNFLLNNNNPIKNYSYTSTKPITKEFNKKNS